MTMTTRQHALTNTRGIPSPVVVALRAIIRQAMFAKHQAEVSREGLNLKYWQTHYEVSMENVKAICEVYS